MDNQPLDKHQRLAQKIHEVSSEEFSRSGGPGGQNVNKVNSRVTLRIPLHKLGLTEEDYARLQRRLGSQINQEGELVIHCDETRRQLRNREIAQLRAQSIIIYALTPAKKRRPTRPSRAAKERRLEEKHHHGRKKQRRRDLED